MASVIEILLSIPSAKKRFDFQNWLLRIWRLAWPDWIRRLALNVLTFEISFRTNSKRFSGRRWRKPEAKVPQLDPSPIRTVAFYLPQFHEIPENNKFWGPGFTEWTNVARAESQFDGHLQPNIPSDLGYYDLAEPVGIFQKQIQLAKSASVSAFCFHYYWFDGNPVMETPIQTWANESSLDFPFMLNWANENWTRRWDGLENDVLLAQKHSPEDDIQFISHVSRYLTDPRYLRVAGKPVLMIYRPMLLPDPQATLDRFRQWFRSNGFGELYLICGLSFEQVDPTSIGFDAAVDYPPNAIPLKNITGRLSGKGAFAGRVHSYADLMRASLRRPEAPYPRFRSVVPRWDNTPRKLERAAIYNGSTPELYKEWLKEALRKTYLEAKYSDERLVFINAWNEWAEGAYLEPDLAFGSSYLSSTKAAITEALLEVSSEANFQVSRRPEKKSVLIIIHDCNLSGAQLLALYLVKSLRNAFGFEVHTIALGKGPLARKFREGSSTFRIVNPEDQSELVAAIRQTRAQRAVLNSAATYLAAEALSSSGVKFLTLVHEMETVLTPINASGGLSTLARLSEKIVFPAQRVLSDFSKFQEIPKDKSLILPQGTYLKIGKASEETLAQTRAKFLLHPELETVLGVGYGDVRKGFDYFVETALLAKESNAPLQFLWVGAIENSLRQELDEQIKKCGDTLVLAGPMSDPSGAYQVCSYFFLSSREDPFPSVLLEAGAANLDIVAFDCGGGSEITRHLEGALLRVGDTEGILKRIEERVQKKANGRAIAKERNDNSASSMDRYLFQILDNLGFNLPSVSVAIPTYNQESWILRCLESVEGQTVRPREVVVYDDASSDGTLEVVRRFMSKSDLSIRVVESTSRHGSASWSWPVAADQLKGEFLWIIEGDDEAKPTFLQETMALFVNPDITFVATGCSIINSKGREDPLGYAKYLRGTNFKLDGAVKVFDRRAAINGGFGWKNVVPHVAAMVSKREHLKSSFSDSDVGIHDFEFSPDWVMHLGLLSTGRMGYVGKALTCHRRHESSLIGGANLENLRSEAERIHGWVRQSLDPRERGVPEGQKTFLQELDDRIT